MKILRRCCYQWKKDTNSACSGVRLSNLCISLALTHASMLQVPHLVSYNNRIYAVDAHCMDILISFPFICGSICYYFSQHVDRTRTLYNSKPLGFKALCAAISGEHIMCSAVQHTSIYIYQLKIVLYAHYMNELNYWMLRSDKALCWAYFCNRLVNSDSSITITLLRYSKSLEPVSEVTLGNSVSKLFGGNSFWKLSIDF